MTGGSRCALVMLQLPGILIQPIGRWQSAHPSAAVGEEAAMRVGKFGRKIIAIWCVWGIRHENLPPEWSAGSQVGHAIRYMRDVSVCAPFPLAIPMPHQSLSHPCHHNNAAR